MADICWSYRCEKYAKLSAFRQNVVSFVENLIKLTESASDKKLGESARCFFDQEGKFPLEPLGRPYVTIKLNMLHKLANVREKRYSLVSA